MKKIIRVISILILFILFNSNINQASNNIKSEVGLKNVGGVIYFLDKDGRKLTGWHRINGEDYYFYPKTGLAFTGVRNIGNTVYLFGRDGRKLTGWHRIDGEQYYFSPEYGGAMLTGIQKIGNSTYLFNTSGEKLYGRYRIKGKNYYFSPEYGGAMLKENISNDLLEERMLYNQYLQKLDKYFGINGFYPSHSVFFAKVNKFKIDIIMGIQNKISLRDILYKALNEDISDYDIEFAREHQIESYDIYGSFYRKENITFEEILKTYKNYGGKIDSEKPNGLRTIGKTRYLFNSNNEKQYGWHRINGKDYYFSPEHGGGMLTGIRKIGQTVYLLSSEGKKTGWHRINEKDYYFSPEHGGGMLTGIRTIKTLHKVGDFYSYETIATYLLTSEGKKTGWHRINERNYYFSPKNGALLTR